MAVADASGSDSSLLAVQVARLFFERQLTKTEIAKRLGISRFRVARVIDQALAEGLVTIQFRDPLPLQAALGRAIEERFGLDLCLVLRGKRTGLAQPPMDLVRLAAVTVDDLLGPDEVVGVAWGATVTAVVDAVRPRGPSGLRVVQLAGGSVRAEAAHNPSEVARRLAERLGAAYHPLYAPTVLESAPLRAALVREPDVRAMVELFDAVSFALVGIGAFGARPGKGDGSALVRSGVLAPAEVARLREAGAVGDLVMHPFAADGRLVPSELQERTIAVSIEQLRRVPRVMAVAGGTAKARAIAGALATGAIKMLVTDEAAAHAIAFRR